MSHTIGQTKRNNQQLNNSYKVDRDSLKPEERTRSPMPISDVDYEFLFNQLLEGIAHGWHERRIVKFFARLGDRAEQKDWIAWLERLRDKASALPPQSKHQLGAMMIRLGELTRSTTEIDKIGAASHRIGKELLFDNIDVWEYQGPDLPSEGTETELAEGLPSDFDAISNRVVEEIESAKSTPHTAAEPKLNSVEEKSPTSPAWLWEYQGPDLPSEGTETELAEGLPSDFDAISNRVVEEIESAKSTPHTAAEPKLNSVEKKSPTSSTWLWEYQGPDFPSEATETELAEGLPSVDAIPDGVVEEIESARSAIPDKLEADLADFPESIAQTQQTTSKIFSSESELGLSSLEETDEIEASSNPNSIIENKSRGSDRIQPIAESIHTEFEIEALDMDRVMNLIQEDEELARQISQKLNSAIAKPNTVPLDRSSLELIESWFNLGLKQVSVGEFRKAIASWDKALRIDPNLPEAWHNRGSALGRLGDYQAAIESFENALAIDPENYQAWNDRAHALYQLQDWTQAADSWSNAIKIMPANHLFWYNRGCALEQLERWEEAIASHEKALSILPDFQPGRLRYINLIADSSRSN